MNKILVVILTASIALLAFFSDKCSAAEPLKTGVCDFSYNRDAAAFGKAGLNGIILGAISSESFVAAFPITVEDRTAFFYLKDAELVKLGRRKGAHKLIVPCLYRLNAGLVASVKVIDCRTGRKTANYFSACGEADVEVTVLRITEKLRLNLRSAAEEDIGRPHPGGDPEIFSVADFSDGAVWQTIKLGQGHILKHAGRSFSVSFSPESCDDTVRKVFGVFLVGADKLEGDFDITLEFSLPAWPDKNGTRIGMGIFARGRFLDDDRWYQQAERLSVTDPDSRFTNHRGDVYLVDTADDSVKGVCAAAGLRGKLKIVRTGDDFRAFCADGDSWDNIYLAKTIKEPVNLFIGAWNHGSLFSRSFVKVSFDKLTIKQIKKRRL